MFDIRTCWNKTRFLSNSCNELTVFLLFCRIYRNLKGLVWLFFITRLDKLVSSNNIFLQNNIFHIIQNQICLNFSEDGLQASEVYEKPSLNSETELFGKIVNSFNLWTIFEKRSIFDVRLGSEYASVAFPHWNWLLSKHSLRVVLQKSCS